jgi:hypothetical protein
MGIGHDAGLLRRVNWPAAVGTYINFQTADEDEERVRATYDVNFDAWSRSSSGTTRRTGSA